MRSARSPGPRRCSPIYPATPTASPSPIAASLRSTTAAFASVGRTTAPTDGGHEQDAPKDRTRTRHHRRQGSGSMKPPLHQRRHRAEANPDEQVPKEQDSRRTIDSAATLL